MRQLDGSGIGSGFLRFRDSDIIEMLVDILREANVTANQAVFAVPSISSFITMVELPTGDRDEVARAVPFEARRYIPIPISEVSLDWQIIDEVPHEARLERYGLDFGYSNDPTASDAIYRWNGAYIVDQVIHQVGLSNKQIADIYINMARALVVADSAEPKSIDEIKSYGINILASTKGKGSVLQGIQYVQDQRIYVTKRSTETLKEYRNYFWITDKDGKNVNEPSPIWNHHMDDVRYGIVSCAGRTLWKPNDPGGVKPLFEGLPG